MKTKGIFVGLSTIDVIYSVSESPAHNQKVAARSQQLLVGGPATNAAITFSHLGGRATIVSSVGMHPLSAMIKAEFQSFNLNHLDLTPETQEPPPISSVWVDDKGQRSVVSANTAGRTISPFWIDPSVLNDARVLMVDGHAMEACQRWADAARLAGLSVVLDAGSWKFGTDILSKSIDIAICSEDFLPPGCRTDEEVIAYLHSAGVSNIAITHGADPIQYSGKGGEGMIQVPQVATVDTTGAGDIFHGAFCYYYASGDDFEQALRRASIIASESCRFPGTRQWMR